MKKEPSFTKDGYPTDATLRTIRSWPWRDAMGLVDYIKRAWRWPAYVKTTKDEKGVAVSIATGGWSGNEDIVRALQGNRPWWGMFWMASKRGGKFEFHIRMPAAAEMEMAAGPQGRSRVGETASKTGRGEIRKARRGSAGD